MHRSAHVARKHPLLVPLILLVMACSGAQAAVDYDPFDYSGTTLNGQGGGSGWSGPWIATGTATSVLLSDDSTSLGYPATFESPMTTPPSVGSRVSTGGLATNASSSRLLGSTTSLAAAGNTLYASALIRKNHVNGNGVNNDNILLEFTDSIGNRRFGFGIEGTGDKPWLNANGSTTTSGPAVAAGDTYFMVAKIVSAVGPELDTAYLKVFGTGYSAEVPFLEPTSWDAELTQNTAAILDRVRVRIDAGNTAAAPGEVTFASATAGPLLSAFPSRRRWRSSGSRGSR